MRRSSPLHRIGWPAPLLRSERQPEPSSRFIMLVTRRRRRFGRHYPGRSIAVWIASYSWHPQPRTPVRQRLLLIAFSATWLVWTTATPPAVKMGRPYALRLRLHLHLSPLRRALAYHPSPAARLGMSAVWLRGSSCSNGRTASKPSPWRPARDQRR